MGATHFSGPVYSKAGFGGQIDPTTGQVLSGPIFIRPTPVSIATAGNVTYTAQQVMNGTISRDPAGANRTDILPTAAQLVAAINGPGVVSNLAVIGLEISLTIYNVAAGAFTVQITMGTGGTAQTPNVLLAIAQNTSRTFRIILTSVASGSEAYSVYA